MYDVFRIMLFLIVYLAPLCVLFSKHNRLDLFGDFNLAKQEKLALPDLGELW